MSFPCQLHVRVTDLTKLFHKDKAFQQTVRYLRSVRPDNGTRSTELAGAHKNSENRQTP